MSEILTDYIQSPFNKSRKDKFILVLDIPEALKPITAKLTRDTKSIQPDTLYYSIFGEIVPTIEIPGLDVPYTGENLAISSNARPPFEPLSVDFTVDNRFNNYYVLYKWLNLLRDQSAGTYDTENLTEVIAKKKNLEVRDIGSNLEYRANMTVYALDEYNHRVCQWEYINAFPTKLGGIKYNYRTPDEMESSVDFKYSQCHFKLVDPVLATP